MPGGVAHIHITRASRYFYSLARFKVLIDSERRARLWSGESLAFDIDPGRHSIQVGMQLLRSPRLDIEVSDGETAFIECDLARFMGPLDYYFKVRRTGLVLRQRDRPLLITQSRWPNQSGIARWRARQPGSRRAREVLEQSTEVQRRA
jgi:hypothetical protein